MERWNSYKLPPSEQEYSQGVEDSPKLEPFEEELFDLSRACNKLWELDFNRLVPGKDYEIQCGDGKKVYNNKDMAEESLFLLSELNSRMAPQFQKLNKALLELVDEFSMVSFTPLDLRKESSIQYLLSQIDNSIQYGEDLDVKVRDFDEEEDNDDE